jgi:hypothetical protein
MSHHTEATLFGLGGELSFSYAVENLPELLPSFLRALAKFRKATVSYFMSVFPSAWQQLGSHWTDFHEI